MTHTTERLAEFVLGFDVQDLGPGVVEAAKDTLVDLLASAAAGWAAPAAQAARRTVGRIFGPGPSTIWWAQPGRQPAGAALANSTAASALDLDDGHRSAGGHPGAAIWPAVMAAGQMAGAGGGDAIAAAAAGYEVAVRIGAARDFSRLDTLSTGRWSAYGAAAAAGRLQAVAPAVLAQALAIAGVLSPGLSAAGYSAVMGNHVKEGIPWSVLTGLTALELAAAGMSGPLDILDHPDYFDARAITAGLGDGWALNGVYFKPYACCRWIHAALDGLLDLMAEAGVTADRIRGITVHTFARALRLNNYPDPPTIEAAQYSVPFCLALGAAAGAQALLPIQPAGLTDAAVVDLARRVRLQVDPDMEARFPAEAGARVVMETGTGRLERTVRFPLGDPANPMARSRLVDKFRRLTRGMIAAGDQERLLEIVATLENQKIAAFDPLLGRPGPAADGEEAAATR
jgi:2-methylcitrate dehydratase PrpD